ncbi:NADH:ubiquinone oxidoreductase [Teratosphaeria destructans]|uniref:NADH dehydrogenase [ubiquinone] 1 beta subcomplex subunit 11, mitochondrial n=1 Tax=Teratosphaeria destructans TaxID=418781 RepID=A0A9W7T198_9PEZI|nr:NADH:ubiquinone oxidoreductase [Teratosphaeria destructans]
MSLLRTSRLITTSRARLQIVPNVSVARAQQQRQLSATSARSAGDHAHEDPYETPNGWLWGVKPGDKYESEGWENVFMYGFFGSLLFGLVGYCYKPDTRSVLMTPMACKPDMQRAASLSVTDGLHSIQTWALEEARRRLEAEGILEDPEKKR